VSSGEHRPRVRRLTPRDRHEAHRAATPLELLFDLCFVVAIAQAAARLHHGIAEGHAGQAVVGYAMVFFAIWWAWMNFTWLASAYDNDDVLSRLLAFVQIAGALVLAAGIPSAADTGDFTIPTVGYVIIRVGLVVYWVRVAIDHRERRKTALRFAIGVTLCELGWVALLFLPLEWRSPGFLLLVPCELAVPIWAERAGATSWHPQHIAERYGLFTLIVLGESILAATLAIQSAYDEGHAFAKLLPIAGGGIAIVFAVWWLYFDVPAHRFLEGNKIGFVWGYGHFFVFGSAAAIGAGLAVCVDHAIGRAHVPKWAASLSVAVPVAFLLVSVWIAHVLPGRRSLVRTAGFPLAAIGSVAAALVGLGVMGIAAMVSALAILTAAARVRVRPS
jgi:low temperature requirement protein LtrA